MAGIKLPLLNLDGG